jgi:hypothetical protein
VGLSADYNLMIISDHNWLSLLSGVWVRRLLFLVRISRFAPSLHELAATSGLHVPRLQVFANILRTYNAGLSQLPMPDEERAALEQVCTWAGVGRGHHCMCVWMRARFLAGCVAG